MEAGLKDRFFEIFFGEKNGYLLIGKETVKKNIEMVEWRMNDNYQYTVRFDDMIKIGDSKIEIEEKMGNFEFLINPNLQAIKLTMALY